MYLTVGNYFFYHFLQSYANSERYDNLVVHFQCNECMLSVLFYLAMKVFSAEMGDKSASISLKNILNLKSKNYAFLRKKLAEARLTLFKGFSL